MVPAMKTLETFPLQPALEALADAVCILDSGWRVTYWNAAAERLMGVPRERIQGRVLWDELPVLRGTATWNALHTARAENSAQDYVEPLPGAGARRFAEASPFAVREAKRLLYDGLGRDWTAHQDANREVMARCFASDDHREGVASFLERRPARFTGS